MYTFNYTVLTCLSTNKWLAIDYLYPHDLHLIKKQFYSFIDF